MVIRDTGSWQIAYKFIGDGQMLLMSTEILLFDGKDFSNVHKLGLINFVHNEHCNPVPTIPIKTMPIGFFADKGEKRFIGDEIFNKAEKRMNLTAYFSSISSTNFRNIESGDNFFKPEGPEVIPTIINSHSYFLLPDPENVGVCTLTRKSLKKGS